MKKWRVMEKEATVEKNSAQETKHEMELMGMSN